jgi:uncharacterized protein (DUF1684 family)
MSYRTQLERHRAEKDRFLKKHPQSPLDHHLQKKFQALDYYPIDEKYYFELPLISYDEVETLEMDTSTGDIREYERIGYLEFEVEGDTAKLNVYQPTDGSEHYFVPFRDKTSGKETYGAGRYLDPERDEEGNFILDFNIAYNPFCAYSEAYTCPLPPVENWLQIPIRAGEKDFMLKQNH